MAYRLSLLRSQARSGVEEVFQQSYMCNPLGASSNHIVEWSAIERCRYAYEIIRVHFEHAQIIQQFGEFSPGRESSRQQDIADFIHKRFLPLFQDHSTPDGHRTSRTFRLGFDVAASGQGDLAAIYIDERKGEELWLRGLFTCRTEDWHFRRPRPRSRPSSSIFPPGLSPLHHSTTPSLQSPRPSPREFYLRPPRIFTDSGRKAPFSLTLIADMIKQTNQEIAQRF